MKGQSLSWVVEAKPGNEGRKDILRVVNSKRNGRANGPEVSMWVEI
jgi:hypothetical protein